MATSQYFEQAAPVVRSVFRSSLATVDDSQVELHALRPFEQYAVAHLVLESEQEAFAGSLEAVFGELRDSQHPECEHPFAIVSHATIVGFFVLREGVATPIWASPNVVTLHSFRIGQSYQGMGYGKAGVTLTKGWISWHLPDVRQLMLAANVRNALARKVYMACGFVDTGATHQGPIGEQNILTCGLDGHSAPGG